MLSILDLKPLPDENLSKSPEPKSPPEPTAPFPPPKVDPRPPIVIESQLSSEPVAASKAQPEIKIQSEPESAAPPRSSLPVKKSVRPLLRNAEVPVSEPVNIPEEPSVEPSAAAVESKDDDGEYELVLGRRQIASWLFVGTLLIAVFSAASYYIGRMSVANTFTELDGKSAPYIVPNSAPYVSSSAVPQEVSPPLPVATFLLPDQSTNSAAKIPAGAVVTPAVIPAAVPGSKPTTTPKPVATVPQALPSPTAAVAPTTPAAPSISATATPASVQAKNIREWNEAAGSSHPNDPPIFAMPQTGALYLQMGAVEKGMAVVLAEGLRRHGFSSFVAPGPTERIFRVLIGPFAKQEDFKKAKAEVDAIDLGTFARRFEK